MLVSKGALGLTRATRAARELDPKASEIEQINWLSNREYEPLPERHRSRLVEIRGTNVRIVEKAYGMAKILIGWSAPVPALTRYIVDCFEQKLTGEEIVERARAVPPRPDRLGKAVPPWENEPAEELLGPWMEPRDQEDTASCS